MNEIINLKVHFNAEDMTDFLSLRDKRSSLSGEVIGSIVRAATRFSDIKNNGFEERQVSLSFVMSDRFLAALDGRRIADVLLQACRSVVNDQND